MIYFSKNILDVLSWIKREVGNLRYFDQMYNFEADSFHKVINQKVTTPNPKYNQFTTPITTTKVTTENSGGGKHF